MEKQDEKEILSLLTEIRSKRDLSSFATSSQMKNGKVAHPKQPILEESIEVKPVENAQNAQNTEGGITPQKRQPKLTHPQINRREMGNELGQFLNKVQQAEAAEQYTFSQFKRYYVDDDIFLPI